MSPKVGIVFGILPRTLHDSPSAEWAQDFASIAPNPWGSAQTRAPLAPFQPPQTLESIPSPVPPNALARALRKSELRFHQNPEPRSPLPRSIDETSESLRVNLHPAPPDSVVLSASPRLNGSQRSASRLSARKNSVTNYVRQACPFAEFWLRPLH